MDGEAWKAAVHGVTEGWTRLSDFTFTFHFHALEKEMATHSSVLACKLSLFATVLGERNRIKMPLLYYYSCKSRVRFHHDYYL